MSKPIQLDQLLKMIAELVSADTNPAIATPEFDQASFLARVQGNMELAREVVEMFSRDQVAMLAEIESHISGRDGPALAAAAHALKGCVSNFSAHDSYDAARKLEELGRDGNFEQSRQTLADLEGHIRRLTAKLTSLTG
jgi:HPt (histidine-containing phosphotransfer) domain-containing protein